MKTPIQELIKILEEEYKSAIHIEARSKINGFLGVSKALLEIEKQIIIDACNTPIQIHDCECEIYDGEQYYNEIFKPC